MTDMREDEYRFDRLADGELSEEQYRSLLASLDDEPGGWRQCAIALLEKQALENELGSLAAEAQTPAPRRRVSTLSHHSPFRGLYAVAVAAGLLIAFGMGALYHSLGDRNGRTNNGPVADDQQNDSKSKDRENNLADRDEPGDNQLANDSSPGNEERLNEVTLVVSDPHGGAERQVSVPLLTPDQVDRDWFTEANQQLPDMVRHTLLQRGHDVRLQQELVPVQLPDGRTLIVPVQQYDVVPVSAGPFQ